MAISIDSLLTKIRQSYAIPDEDGYYTDDVLIAFANEELQDRIFPDIIEIHSRYNNHTIQYPLTSNGGDTYPTGVVPMPPRCWGRSITDAQYITNGNVLLPLSLLDTTQRDLYAFTNVGTCSSVLIGVIVQNDGLELIPKQHDNNGTLLIYYTQDVPTIVSDITLTTGITNIQFNSTTNIATITVVPFTSGGTLDLYCPNSGTNLFDIFNIQSGATLKLDELFTRTSATTYTSTTLNQDQVTELSNFQLLGYPIQTYITPNLIITPRDQNYYTPIIPELDNYLRACVGWRVAKSRQISEEINQLASEVKDLWQKMVTLISKRVEEKAMTLKPLRGIKRYTTGYTCLWGRTR